MRALRLLAFALMASDVPAALAQDSLVAVTVIARRDSVRLPNAIVRAGTVGATTDRDGRATLRLAPGDYTVHVRRLGFRPESTTVTVVAVTPMTVDVALVETIADLDAVIVSSARTDRRLEQEPTRIEVLAREEIEEKLMMTPGDIAMMLNETSGLRVQTTSPSLGGANVRVQGLRGRYTQLLSDGLPLYGGQVGGLGMLQIPPLDLRQVEVIKGAASALYGSGALGGVINLMSRRPAAEHERELLLNQTTRQGSDAVLWLSGPATSSWGYSLLAGGHRQSRRDLDADGWTDMSGYERIGLRPRARWTNQRGASLFATLGTTLEDRTGGTMPGRDAPDGEPFAESLVTRRFDAGVVGHALTGVSSSVQLRASAMIQRHEHRFGAVAEDDRHATGFVEIAWTTARGPATSTLGAAFQRETYTAADVPRFDYAFSIPSAFVQFDADLNERVTVTAGARADSHSEYGTLFYPRVAALVHAGRDWSVRASIAGGAFAPTPFTEDTEVIGLTPLDSLRGLKAERASTASIDIGGPLGAFELNATVFASRVRDAVALRDDAGALSLVNVDAPTRTSGTELFIRWKREPFTLTASHTFVHSTEYDVNVGARRDVPLTPKHAVGVVGMWEWEDAGRIGVECYYTGAQSLDDNPYRGESRPYVIVGFLAEKHIGRARVFVNAENLGNVRQTRYDPLVRTAPGRGGRWTTDAWTELSGRTINGGVRLSF